MGCDIHCYAEYKPSNQEHWRNFGGRVNPGRNYHLFGLLAGVRSVQEPLYPPRGIPNKLAWAAKDDWFLFITETEGDGYCTLARAQRWVAESKGRLKIIEQSGKPTWVEHPDWHTPSWLTTAEFEHVLTRAADDDGVAWLAEYFALLAAMQELERRGHDARVVFWFDN